MSRPGPDARHRDFGPVPLAPLPADTTILPSPDYRTPHTDACIRDAARWGFCNHTRLRASSSQISRQRDHDQHLLARSIRREVASTVAFALLVAFTVLAVHLTGWYALALVLLSATGWLLTFTYGLPTFMTADLSKALPPDTRQRLEADLHVQKTARANRRRNRRAHRKRKGP